MDDQKVPVFRIINGERIRVPNDIRDPIKRYSRVVDLKNGTYDLEFTEEQEKQRNEEEAQWEADRPKREEEQKTQREAAKKFRESLRYEGRVVAYIDILGWRAAIEKSKNDAEYTQKIGITLASIMEYANLTEWMMNNSDTSGWPGDPQITHFSDTIAISVKNDQMARINLPQYLRSLVFDLLERGFLVRGGIASGLLYHRGSIIYGSALVEAYELEKKASNPRIILDKSIASDWQPGPPVFSKDNKIIGYQKTWRKDKIDNHCFYDFLQPFQNMPPIHEYTKHDLLLLKHVKELIRGGLEQFKNDPCILEKYIWASHYFDEIVDEYQLTEINKIMFNN